MRVNGLENGLSRWNLFTLHSNEGGITIYLKGDKVRLHNGIEGEITETWGYHRLFARIRIATGKVISIMGSEIAEKLPDKTYWGRR